MRFCFLQCLCSLAMPGFHQEVLHGILCQLFSLIFRFSFLVPGYSADTNFRLFQVKINCFKFIINKLQQRCHKILLDSLFLTSKNLLLGVFLSRKIITILRKMTINFRQVPLKGVLLSVRVLEYLGKILQKHL